MIETRVYWVCDYCGVCTVEPLALAKRWRRVRETRLVYCPKCRDTSHVASVVVNNQRALDAVYSGQGNCHAAKG